jgi:hypothetical protein
VSLFGDHIVDVFETCTLEEMPGVYAWRVIAPMADVHVGFRHLHPRLIGNTVGLAGLAAD